MVLPRVLKTGEIGGVIAVLWSRRSTRRARAIGPGRVGFRICPGIKFNGMGDADPHEANAALLKAVERLGLAYCHLIHIPLEGQDALDLARSDWSGAVIENMGSALEKVRSSAFAWGRRLRRPTAPTSVRARATIMSAIPTVRR